MVFVKRKPSMTDEAFKDYYLTKHAPAVRAFPEIKRYVVNYVVRSLTPERSPYDSVAELWFEDEESLRRLETSERFKEFVRTDNPRFQDFAARRVVMADE